MAKKIAIIIILLLCGVFGVMYYLQNKTYFNDNTVSGNSSGNLLNNGLYCEIDNTIYFSNSSDNGSLYSMDLDCTNFKKLHNDKVASINADEHYIYYSRKNNEKETNFNSVFAFNNVGIYRVKRKNASSLKLLYNNPTGLVHLYGNYLYYQHYNKKTGLEFYKVKIDSSEETFISSDAIVPGEIIDNTLYYSGVNKDHFIRSMDLETNTQSIIFKGNTFHCMIKNNFIYYIDSKNNYNIARIDLDGKNQESLVKERCSTYNISNDGSYLYYQVDGGENNRICRLDLKTKETEVLLTGDYKNINVTSNYVFFQEFFSEKTYILSTDSTAQLGEFNPPVLQK